MKSYPLINEITCIFTCDFLAVLHVTAFAKLTIFFLTILTFPQKFGYFMHIRPPDDAVLVELFPVVLYEEKEV